MDRVFLDANVLFSAAYSPDSRLNRLWRMAESNRVELLTSTYAVAEAVRNLHHAGQLQQLTDLLNRLEIGGDCLSPDTIPIPPVLNNKDKPILRAAIAMHATHLLTGDITYFGQIFGKRISGVMIQTPSTYLESR